MHFELGDCVENVVVFKVGLFFHMYTVIGGLKKDAAVSHPWARACFFCSSAWPIIGFSNHVGRKNEGPEISYILCLHFVPHLVGCCYYFLNTFAIQQAGADKTGRARETSQHAEEACPGPAGIRNEAEIHSHVCLYLRERPYRGTSSQLLTTLLTGLLSTQSLAQGLVHASSLTASAQWWNKQAKAQEPKNTLIPCGGQTCQRLIGANYTQMGASR